MKGTSRSKVGKKIGAPAFRTPSFFKNKPKIPKNIGKIKNILDKYYKR